MEREPARPGLGRRAFLAGLGGAAGLVASRGLGVAGWLGSDPAVLSPEQALRELVASFSPRQRELVLLPADHPSRQTANTVAFLSRPHAGSLLDARQFARLERVARGMLSDEGWRRFAQTFAFEGRMAAAVLSIYGDPLRGPAQAVLAGGHYTLRMGNDGLGGALAYGAQIGNGRYRIAGNAFAAHSDAANRFVAALDASELAQARLDTPPSELLLQPLGAGARFPGVAWSRVSPRARELAESLLGQVLATFAPAAGRDIDPGSLHFATYASRGFYPDMTAWGELSEADRAARGAPYWQVWRIEGPDVVIHFKGHPHLHAYVQVTDSARRSVGESLARVAATIEGEAMRDLLEAALRRASGEQLGFHPVEVFGRFCPGEITTGTAWTLDPFGNRIAIVEIEGRAMAPAMRARLAGQGHAIADSQRYRIATHEFAASTASEVGEPDRVELLPIELREALVDHLRAGALANV